MTFSTLLVSAFAASDARRYVYHIQSRTFVVILQEMRGDSFDDNVINIIERPKNDVKRQ